MHATVQAQYKEHVRHTSQLSTTMHVEGRKVHTCNKVKHRPCTFTNIKPNKVIIVLVYLTVKNIGQIHHSNGSEMMGMMGFMRGEYISLLQY